MTLALLTLVCVLTYSFEIVFGLAGTIMMLFVMTLFYDAKTLVIYSALPQILVAGIGLVRSPKTVRVGFLARMLGFAAFGFLGGLYLFYLLPVDIFQHLLAAAITAAGVYLIVAPGQLRLSPLSARVLDICAGASQALFGISGPIAMTRLLASFDDKLVVRNYALAFFLALNVCRAVSYVLRGTITTDIAEMMLVSAPFLAVGLWFANQLHMHVNESVFRRVVAWVIVLGGVSLLAQGGGGG